MALPLVNQFLIPCEIWQTREPTQDDIDARLLRGLHMSLCFQPVEEHLIDKIDTPEKAASYMVNGLYNTYIENRISQSLNDINSGYQQARELMPNVTPKILSEYQRLYSSQTKMDIVNTEIINAGDFLAEDQILFHGGGILQNIGVNGSYTTTRPLSTSFCPVKAHLNGAWRGKYFHENEANLIVLIVKSMSKPAYVFKINRTDKGHEKEVLIASGATLKVISKNLLCSNYEVRAASEDTSPVMKKTVPFYLTYATIS